MVLLFFVILVTYEIENSLWSPVWEMAVHLAVAGDVFDRVLFCAVNFPRDVLDKI